MEISDIYWFKETILNKYMSKVLKIAKNISESEIFYQTMFDMSWCEK